MEKDEMKKIIRRTQENIEEALSVITNSLSSSNIPIGAGVSAMMSIICRFLSETGASQEEVLSWVQSMPGQLMNPRGSSDIPRCSTCGYMIEECEGQCRKCLFEEVIKEAPSEE